MRNPDSPEASRLRGHLEAMVTPSGKVLDRAHYYDLLDDSIKARTAAGELRDASTSVKVPKGLGRALGILGVVGAAIANGWQDVEDLGSAVGDLASGAWEEIFG